MQSLLAGFGLGQSSHAASLWVLFAACGVTELAISFLICTPLERFWPLTGWPKRNSIAADVAYAFFVRIVLFPLIAYFEFNWLRQGLDGFLHAHAVTPLSLPALIPVLASWPAVVFIANFAILDLADYWVLEYAWNRWGPRAGTLEKIPEVSFATAGIDGPPETAETAGGAPGAPAGVPAVNQ